MEKTKVSNIPEGGSGIVHYRFLAGSLTGFRGKFLDARCFCKP